MVRLNYYILRSCLLANQRRVGNRSWHRSVERRVDSDNPLEGKFNTLPSRESAQEKFHVCEEELDRR